MRIVLNEEITKECCLQQALNAYNTAIGSGMSESQARSEASDAAKEHWNGGESGSSIKQRMSSVGLKIGKDHPTLDGLKMILDKDGNEIGYHRSREVVEMIKKLEVKTSVNKVLNLSLSNEEAKRIDSKLKRNPNGEIRKTYIAYDTLKESVREKEKYLNEFNINKRLLKLPNVEREKRINDVKGQLKSMKKMLSTKLSTLKKYSSTDI